MNSTKKAYLDLINDTLSYIHSLLPKNETHSNPPPVSKTIEPKPNPTTPVQAKPALPSPPKKEAEKLTLNPPPAAPSHEAFEKLRRILAEIAPELYLHQAPPPDAKAKQIKQAWKIKSETPAIPILFQGTKYRSFLENVAKAISLTFFPSRLVEVEPGKNWELFLESSHLKLILIPDHLLFTHNELLPFYKENPNQKTRFLGNIPLLLLPDLSLYFKDPYLKRFLWNVICQTLSQI